MLGIAFENLQRDVVKGCIYPFRSVAEVRDTVLAVLGRQTADGLLAADGKGRLKVELKAALAEHNRDLKVMDVFFTDFLVQR